MREQDQIYFETRDVINISLLAGEPLTMDIVADAYLSDTPIERRLDEEVDEEGVTVMDA